MSKEIMIGEMMKTQPYDAPHLVLNEEKMDDVYNHAMNDIYKKNIEAAERIGLTEDFNNKEIISLPNQHKISNILFAKKVFENLEQQSQYQKINIVLENPQATFSEVLEGITESLKIAKKLHSDYQKVMRKGSGEMLADTTGMHFHFLDLIAETPRFNEIYLKEKMARLGQEEQPHYLDPYQTAMTASIIYEYSKNPNFEDWAKKIDISYLRYELDFSEGLNLKLYVGFSKIFTTREKDFRPWDSNGNEILYAEMNESEIKNQMMNRGYFRSMREQTKLEQVLDLYEETRDQKYFEEAEELAGVCPVKQLSYIRAYLSLQYQSSAIITIMSYLLKYNIIEKKTEKTRVLKPNKGKKKKGSNNYKSIVKTYYHYNEEKQEEVALENEEIYNRYHESRKQEESRDSSKWEFEKDEWDVKPHTRRLKNGKVIQVNGQKRRRQIELLKNKKTPKRYKTMGITEGEIEKVRENAENK